MKNHQNYPLTPIPYPLYPKIEVLVIRGAEFIRIPRLHLVFTAIELYAQLLRWSWYRL